MKRERYVIVVNLESRSGLSKVFRFEWSLTGGVSCIPFLFNIYEFSGDWYAKCKRFGERISL